MTDDQPRFDPHGPGLVWAAVAGDIAARIESGALAPGSRLPSEVALAEEYGCARMTVHRAIRDLRERGLVAVTIGKGTYVAERPASR